MHIPNGFVSDPVNLVCAALSFAALGVAACPRTAAKTDERNDSSSLPLLALVSAFIFAAQMLNFPIGGGTSGHFLGALLAAVLLGPWGACGAMALVLGVQGAFFADGGVSALGTNILNMGVISGVVAYPVLRKIRSFLPVGQGGFLAAVGLASFASVVMASAACAVELALSGTSPLGIVFPAMLQTHAWIGIGEAVVSMLAVKAVLTLQPQLLPTWAGLTPARTAVPVLGEKAFGGACAALALALSVLASPFASAFPDGLEKVAEDQGFLLRASDAVSVWTASPFADYQVEMIQDGALSTSAAGLIGTVLVLMLGLGLHRSIKALHTDNPMN